MRLTTAILLLFTASTLGACGGMDDVELSLPFVGNVLEKQKAKEAKMATRGSLVLPPSVKGLPEPTTKEQVAAANNWPVDPETTKKQQARVAALKEKQYRKDGDWKGERDTGNGIEDFNNKVDWHKRQGGVLQSWIKGSGATD